MSLLAMLGRAVKAPVTQVLGRVERRFVQSVQEVSPPPVLILGPPRSGTTLAYQVLVHCFEVAYLCNAAGEHYRYAATMTRLYRRRMRRHASSFASDYGRTSGVAGPNEGLGLWGSWMPDSYIDETFLGEDAKASLRATVGAVTRIVGAPFVNKDTHHTVRVRALNALFPGCVFVYLDRDPAAVASSLLGLRRRRVAEGKGDMARWTSVRPRAFPRLAGLDPVRQVVGQALHCAHDALSDLEAVASDRTIVVPYERLCGAPAEEIERIARFLAARGLELRPRNAPPPQFERPGGRRAATEDAAAIRVALAEMLKEEPWSTSPLCDGMWASALKRSTALAAAGER